MSKPKYNPYHDEKLQAPIDLKDINQSGAVADDAITFNGTEWVPVSLNLKEDVVNKATDLSSPDNTKYPTTLAVQNALNSIAPVSPVYMLSGINSDISGYESAVSLSSYSSGALATVSQTVTTSETLLEEFATDLGFPNSTALPIGLFSAHWETQKASGSNNYYSFFKLFKRDLGGIETLLLTSDNSSQTALNTIQQVSVSAFNSSIISLLATDRLILKVYAQMVSSSASITLRWDDNTDSRLELAGSPLSYTPEDVANKATSFAVINHTLYPSIQTVDSALTNKAGTNLSNLASTAVNTDVNPDTDITRSLGTSLLAWLDLNLSKLKFGSILRFDVAAGVLYDDTNAPLVDLNAISLLDNASVPAINWQVRKLLDNNNVQSIDWQNRIANDTGGVQSVDYENRKLQDTSVVDALDWRSRILQDSASGTSILWDARQLTDNAGFASADWQSRQLLDDSELIALDYLDRRLYANDGTTIVADFSNGAGITTITQAPNDNSNMIATTAYVDAQPKTVIQKFTASGTWTKPVGAKKVSVAVVSGSGGGGSGRLGATGTVRCGGGSGVASSFAWATFDATDLTATVTVTVGAKGLGGASVTTNDTNGNAGGAGGASSFGTYLHSRAASGGNGGTAANGTGGVAQTTAASVLNTPQITGVAASTSGGIGTSGTASTGALPTVGGAGGGVSTGNTGASGGAGGTRTAFSALNNIAGGTAGTVAVPAGGNGNVSSGSVFFGISIGTGGGGGVGGGTNTGNIGAAGGDAGGYGASGGGGGGGTNTFSSGKGGDGFNGIVVVMTEF